MASIIKKLNKQTGITYVYESESYWDKEKQQPRSKRKLIGKIDPDTGEIVPTGKKGRPKKESDDGIQGNSSVDLELLCQKQAEQLRQQENEILELKKRVMDLNLTVNDCRRRLEKISTLSKLEVENAADA